MRIKGDQAWAWSMGQQESRVGNYEVGRVLLEQSDVFPWSICPGLDNDDETATTLFLHKRRSNSAANQLYWLENGVQHLRSIRHPHVVKFLEYFDDDELKGSSIEFCVVTSIVTPLQQEIHSMTALEISNGLAGIARALQFLHEQCQLSHNNVCDQAVFVSDVGCKWQLGCFELACPFSMATIEYLSQIEMFRHKEAIPPEDAKDQSHSVTDCPHARDVYAFGVLIESLLEPLSSIGSVSDNFEESLPETLLNSDPMARPQFAVLLTDPLFSGEVTQIMDFLSNVTIKSQEEKEEFFRSLPSRLHAVSDGVIVRLMLPLLINRFILNEPSAIDCLLPHLFVANKDTASDTNGLLPLHLYKDYVLPLIVDLFGVHDTSVRLLLLQYWSHYVPLFDREILQDEVLPELLIGLQDDNPAIVSSTLRALADLVPVLGIEAVIGSESDHIFSEKKPRFAVGSHAGRHHPPSSPSLSVRATPVPHSPIHPSSSYTGESSSVSEREKIIGKREERRRQREEAHRQRELRHGSAVHQSPVKLMQAMKISDRTELNNSIDEDNDKRTAETLERKQVEEQQREAHREAEKQRREQEQLQLLADARIKGLSSQEIEAMDEALSKKDRRSSSDDDWETPFSAPTVSHDKGTSRNLAGRQSSQHRNKDSWGQHEDSWNDFNAFDDENGEKENSVENGQLSSRTTKEQFQSSGNKFVDFLDVEREERERLEALSQQEENEVDLFADMQPAVARSLVASQKNERTDDMKRNTAVTTALNYNVMDQSEDGGWGDGDWGDELQ